jgi:endonuclease/exonuclease/phosphatase family metal-dependent hydrolase
LLKFIRRFIFTFNIIAIILLFGSYFSVFISPNEAWIFAFLGLAYPIMLFVNLLFALFWLVQLKIKAAFSVVAILVGMNFIQRTFQFHKSHETEEKGINIVSYNAGLFGFFQSRWYVEEMIQKVNELKPDILCVQEVLNIRNQQNSTIDSIRRQCGFEHVYFQKLEDGRKRGEYGMAIFSNYRISRSELVHFDGATGNMCVFADILIGEKTYRLYNVHLQSFKFKKQDYKFIKEMPEDNEEKIRQSKNILNRMKYAYVKRADQVDEIRQHIAGSTHPHFVVGDFNDPPVSYSYAVLSRGLRDAFVEKGFGMGKTYIGIMPNFRIDYILFPADFKGLKYSSYKLSSDHSMIETSIDKAEN